MPQKQFFKLNVSKYGAFSKKNHHFDTVVKVLQDTSIASLRNENNRSIS